MQNVLRCDGSFLAPLFAFIKALLTKIDNGGARQIERFEADDALENVVDGKQGY